MSQTVYLVDTARTPFLKARGKSGAFSASDLAVAAGRQLLSGLPISPACIDEVIIGCMVPRETEANIARLVALRSGCGDKTPGWTVQRNCASGMQALDCAIKTIQLGRAGLVLAGGTEAMSRAPISYNDQMVAWFSRMQYARSFKEKIKAFSQLKLKALFSPIISLLAGLSDPLSGLSMGQTAEILAYRFNISREEMDAFALRSHQRVVAAREAGHLADLMTLFDHHEKFYDADDGVRPESNLESLARLRPFFDKKFGLVTAGNSSQVTDGASLMLLASERSIKQYQLPVLAKIVDVEWAALDPDVMGLGPVYAATPLLQRHRLSLSDIDYWEINEAFSAQVIACLRAWQDDAFCQQALGLKQAPGKIDEARLNVDGGAIALGHPVGASGSRIVAQLAHVLKRQQAKRGIAAICIGGGQGGAMLLESV